MCGKLRPAAEAQHHDRMALDGAALTIYESNDIL